jgi:uncharacterized repeat protein (TIGR03806 family)
MAPGVHRPGTAVHRALAALALAALAGCGGGGGGDDAAALPTLAIADAARAEGNAGTATLTFTVTLSAAAADAVAVQFATADGTAVAGSDYTARSGVIDFTPGATSATIAVTVLGDASVEGDETFTVTLADPAGATLARATATGTITNDDAASGALGLDARPSNPDCVAPARPTAATLVATQDAYPAAPGFVNATKLLQAPGAPGRWFVLEKAGRIRTFTTANPAGVTTWLDYTGRVDTASEGGMLGLAFHPAFPATREAYLSYTVDVAGAMVSRITRVRLDDAFAPTGGGTVEEVLLEVNQPFDNHNGGDIAFGADGFLYIGIGDGGSAGDPGNVAQNTTRLLGKMLRIDVLGVAFPTPRYRIPADNPFAANPRCGPGTNAAACPEVYAWGFRNPWRWSFDPPTGQLWLADVGQNAREEINVVARGGNYGWRCREGTADYSPNGCPAAGLLDPVAEYPHTSGNNSVTGGYVYRGSAIPALRGRYVFGDFSSGRIWALAADGSGGYDLEELVDTPANVPAFGVDAAGELYYVEYAGSGRIRRLVAGGGAAVDTIPTNLADTGCVNPADPTEPAAGLIPYGVNAPFWSDGAAKARFLGLPDGARINRNDAAGEWLLPPGTVVMKTFELAGRPVETRLLMRHPDGIWAGYTWEWNDAGTAATRVTGGKRKSVAGQEWIFPSEGECLQCHTQVAGFSLGLETAQLNGNFTYPSTGRTANQLATLAGIGVFTTPLPAPVASLPRLPDPHAAGVPVGERARAWLDTNCAQCHRPGGPTPVSLDLRYATALGATATCDLPPQAGDLGIADARLVAPGSAGRSVLPARAARRDANGMPPLGSALVDTAGVAVLDAWINSLTGCN